MYNRVIGRGKSVEAFERDLKKGGDNYDGEDEDTNRLETSPANGVEVSILPGDESVEIGFSGWTGRLD